MTASSKLKTIKESKRADANSEETAGVEPSETDVAEANNAVITQLAKTIEGEIIPRLLLAHQGQKRLVEPDQLRSGFAFEEVQRFAGLIISPDGTRCNVFLDRVREDGVHIETIIMDLLAPAAAYLGELWKADLCSFTEVTVGLSRLRQILRELSPAFENESPSWRHGRRALLLPTPGEQHSFGIFVVETFFRREGWDVWGGPVETPEAVSKLVENQWFAVAGFSLSSEKYLDRLTGIIRSIRRASCNSDICVLVGGPFFLEKPEFVSIVGADGGAGDGRQAVIQARTLLGRAVGRTQ